MDKKSFFDLIKDGDMDKVKEKLIMKGKSPKPTCPIFFFKEDEERNKKDDDDNN